MAPTPSARHEPSASGYPEEEQHEEFTEHTPLIASNPAAVAGQQQASADIKSTINQQLHDDEAPSVSSSKQDSSGQCRICLEEDTLGNLESPCGCTGTQQYAHKDCIQKWVNEKHNNQCEICQKQYEGGYIVPPPPPPAAGEPLHVVAPLGGLYLTMEDARVPEHLLNDVYDEWDDHRQPTVSWCFSFMMFLLFMMFLHSTMTVTVPDSGSSSSGVPGVPDPSPSIDPSSSDSGSGSSGAMPAAGLAAGASLLFLWLMTKLFLVVLPVVLVMRIFARAQEQAEAAAAAGGSVPGLDAPAAAGSSSGSAARHIMAQLAGRANGRGDSGSSLADLELEVMQARRAALSRFGGREALVWGSPAAAAAVAAEEGRRPGDAHHHQQQEEQRMIAAMRAMVRAAIINTHRELMERRSRAAAAAGGGDADSHGAAPAAPQREQGAV